MSSLPSNPTELLCQLGHVAAWMEGHVVVTHAFLPVTGCPLLIPHVVYILDLYHDHGFIRIGVPIQTAHPQRKKIEQHVNRCMQHLQLEQLPLDRITIVDCHEPFE